MAEVVEKAGVKREKGYLYFLRGSDVFKQVAGRGRQGVPLKVYDGTFKREDGFMYFLDTDGNIARARRSVGGQPRKKSAATKAARKPAARKPAARKPAAKPAAKKPAAKKPAARSR